MPKGTVGSAPNKTAKRQPYYEMTGFAIDQLGIDYVLDEFIGIVGGVRIQPVIFKVTAVNEVGNIQGLSVQSQGRYLSKPANPVHLKAPSRAWGNATGNATWTRVKPA
jgi:hypothetical protein